jgi:hypothetical protein
MAKQFRFLSEVLDVEKTFDYTLERADTIFQIDRAGQTRQMTYSVNYNRAQADDEPARMVELMQELVLDHCSCIKKFSPDDAETTDKGTMQKILDHIWPNDLGELVSAVLNGKEAALDRFQQVKAEAEATDSGNS